MPTCRGRCCAHVLGDRIVPTCRGRCCAHVLGDRIVPTCRGRCCAHVLGDRIVPPRPVGPCPPPLTLALVLDGEAEDVPGAEAGAVVHPPVEERVGVGVLDVEDLAGGGHVPGDALVRRDADLVALRAGRGGVTGTAWGEG